MQAVVNRVLLTPRSNSNTNKNANERCFVLIIIFLCEMY